MEKTAFATLEPTWWLVDPSAPSDVEALRKEIDRALGSEWHQSKDKLEQLYDILGSLAGDELDAAGDPDAQAAWLKKAAGVAAPKHEEPPAAPAHSAPDNPADAAGHPEADAEAPTVPEAPPLTEEEISALASEAGVDPSYLEGIDLSEIEGEDVDDEDEADEDEADEDAAQAG